MLLLHSNIRGVVHVLRLLQILRAWSDEQIDGVVVSSSALRWGARRNTEIIDMFAMKRNI